VFFPYVQNIFDESGRMNEEFKQRYEKSLGKLFDELLWFARILKDARQTDK
jgi:hypothetical protein